MEAVAIAEGLIDGVLSVPPTLWHGIKRVAEFYGNPEEREKIEGQNYRAYMAIEKLVRYGFHGIHSPLTHLVRIIVHHCYESLPEDQKQNFLDYALKKTAYIGSRVYAKGQLSDRIADYVVARLLMGSAEAFISESAINISFLELSLISLLEKAGQSSGHLKALFPRLWRDLMLKDLDMLYFIVEKPMKKYLEAIRRKKWNLK